MPERGLHGFCKFELGPLVGNPYLPWLARATNRFGGNDWPWDVMPPTMHLALDTEARGRVSLCPQVPHATSRERALVVSRQPGVMRSHWVKEAGFLCRHRAVGA